MTNYTYEEKKIAIKVLEDLLDEMGIDTRHDSYLLHPYTLMIHTKIKELKTVTFGDIKNQVGVRFRVECNNPILQVITLQNNERLALNTENCVVVPIGDYDRVEVINETETN